MKNRVTSACILIALFIIFYLLGGNFFIFFTSCIGMLAYKEITDLKKYPKVVIHLGLISMFGVIILNSVPFGYYNSISYLTIFATFILLIIPSLLKKYQNVYFLKDAFSLIAMILFVGLSLATINIYVLSEKTLLLYILLIAIFNDTFAYLIGKKYGKIKFSDISPSKTVEGYIAGNIAGILVGVIFYLKFLNSNLSLLFVIFMTVILNLACQVGDLIFSKIKRENNIKDFSHILPGHGGILDRIDSLLFESMVFIIIINIISKF